MPGRISLFFCQYSGFDPTLSHDSTGLAAQITYDGESCYLRWRIVLLAMANLTPHLPLFPAEFSSPFSSLFDSHSPQSPVAYAIEFFVTIHQNGER